MSGVAVTCSNLTLSYERWGHSIRALHEFNIEVPAGQCVMVVGPNGSGKSTLLRAISGEIEADSGTVTWGPAERKGAPRIFTVCQDPASGSVALLTVGENLRLADPDASRSSRYDRERGYREVLEASGLNCSLAQLAATLSGGQRQLLAFLVASYSRAPVILLDEPLSALDQPNAARCEAAIQRLSDGGRTILYVTHDLQRACAFGNRTVGLAHGKLTYDDDGTRGGLDGLKILWEGFAQDGEAP